MSCDAVINLLLSWGGEIIAALVGAFVGAGAAFWLQMRREKQLKADKEYAAIIKAQHSLLFMWRLLASIRYTYLDPERQDVDRHRHLGKYWMVDKYVSIDLDSLTFLFRPNMRGLVTLCFFFERAFVSALDAIKERNEYWTDIFSSSGADVEINPATSMAKVPFDPQKDHILKCATDALYNSVDTGMAYCVRAFGELRKSGKIVFPGRDFINEENLTEAAAKRDMANKP